MAGRQWYAAIGGKQGGPFSDERFRQLIATGVVTADTLVWCAGMTDWTRAAAIPGLVSDRPRAPPVAPAAPVTDHAYAVPAEPHPPSTGTHVLSTTVRVWPLLGRSLLLLISEILIVPIPWAVTSYYRWFVDHIELPEHQRVAFAGRPGDIWYIFIANALCGYVGLFNHLVQALLILLTTLFYVLITRWFFANLVWEGQTNPLQFKGGYWPMLGWTLLTAISVITVVGWAWVLAAWMRWICRNVAGSTRRLVFTASGWSILWRTLAFGLSSIFIVPIHWMLHWYVRWTVSQFALSGAGAHT